MGKHKFTKEEISDLLINLYSQNKTPITSTMIENDIEIPTRKVFTRLFGSWQNACEYAHVPYERKSINLSNSEYHQLKNRVGEEKLDKNGCVVKIIEYNNSNNIVIEFQDEHRFRVHTTYSNWIKERFKNPYHKSIYNVACVGNAITKINGIKKKSYMVWYAMIQRCYYEAYKSKPTYVNCEVCEEWLCYENFEKWFNNNYYMIDNETMDLDKDILVKNNNLYCPDRCIFVPHAINVLFEKRKKLNGLPIGIKFNKVSNKYETICDIDENGNRKIKCCHSLEEALQIYKCYKEKYIKMIADKYKNIIPDKLYHAMYQYKYEIEI